MILSSQCLPPLLERLVLDSTLLCSTQLLLCSTQLSIQLLQRCSSSPSPSSPSSSLSTSPSSSSLSSLSRSCFSRCLPILLWTLVPDSIPQFLRCYNYHHHHQHHHHQHHHRHIHCHHQHHCRHNRHHRHHHNHHNHHDQIFSGRLSWSCSSELNSGSRGAD